MSLSVDFSGWQVRQCVSGSHLLGDEVGGERLGDELSQHYEFSGLDWAIGGAADGRAELRIDCRLEMAPGGILVNTFLHFYLRPLGLAGETKMIMRLRANNRMKNADVQVVAMPISTHKEDSNWIVGAVIGTSQDTQKLIGLLKSGDHLQFLLFTAEQKQKQLFGVEFEEFCDGVGAIILPEFVKLPLPPDKVFEKVYDESYLRIADAQPNRAASTPHI